MQHLKIVSGNYCLGENLAHNPMQVENYLFSDIVMYNGASLFLFLHVAYYWPVNTDKREVVSLHVVGLAFLSNMTASSPPWQTPTPPNFFMPSKYSKKVINIFLVAVHKSKKDVLKVPFKRYIRALQSYLCVDNPSNGLHQIHQSFGVLYL